MLIQEGVSLGMNITKDKYFIDTNIIVYMFDKKNIEKQAKSVSIIRQALKNGNGIISFQVIQEFCNVAMKKFESPLTYEDCKTFINRFLYPLCDVFQGIELYNSALLICVDTGYSFYDSLILSATIKSNCKILYTEDMQNRHLIKGIEIINPFI